MFLAEFLVTKCGQLLSTGWAADICSRLELRAGSESKEERDGAAAALLLAVSQAALATLRLEWWSGLTDKQHTATAAGSLDIYYKEKLPYVCDDASMMTDQ